MKKTGFIVFLMAIAMMANAQVFNTASSLKKGQFALGVLPAFYDGNFGYLFVDGGFGIKRGIDMNIRLGLGDGGNYFGADLEWLLAGSKPYVSLTTGGHVAGDFTLDLGLNLSIPIRGDTEIYSGLDSDLTFADDTNFDLWVPIGLDLAIHRNLALILEGDIPITDGTPTIFGGGVIFYF